MLECLFATVTNVDFDPARVETHLRQAAAARDKARTLYEAACAKAGQTPEKLSGPAAWQPAADRAGLVRQGEEVGIPRFQATLGVDIAGLLELTLYGLKGAAAYADHALQLGYEDPQIYATFHEALDFLAGQPTNVDAILGWVDEDRRTESPRDGTARSGEYRNLRPPRADRRSTCGPSRARRSSSPATT